MIQFCARVRHRQVPQTSNWPSDHVKIESHLLVLHKGTVFAFICTMLNSGKHTEWSCLMLLLPPHTFLASNHYIPQLQRFSAPRTALSFPIHYRFFLTGFLFTPWDGTVSFPSGMQIALHIYLNLLLWRRRFFYGSPK